MTALLMSHIASNTSVVSALLPLLGVRINCVRACMESAGRGGGKGWRALAEGDDAHLKR